MEYERIHKVQTGVMSPSKLRMMLGAHQQKKKATGTSSSRASPSKALDTEFARSSLLTEDATENCEGADGATAPCFNVPNSVKKLVFSGQGDQQDCSLLQLDLDPSGKCDQTRLQDASQSGNAGTAHPLKLGTEDACGASAGVSNTFEFHKGERVFAGPFMGPFSRPLPSKWNDAEKWIVCRQKQQPSNTLKRSDSLNQGSRATVNSGVRVAPEAVLPEQRCSSLQAVGGGNRKENPFQSSFLNVVEKFSFSSSSSGRSSAQLKNVVSVQKEMNQAPQAATPGIPPVKSVCMRDIGTEMTPVASQDPSRIGTPIGAVSPCRSFASSKASSPRRGSPAPSPMKVSTVVPDNSGTYELSEQEVRIRIRKEIVALGLKLGKANIAAWASKDDMGNFSSYRSPVIDQAKRNEFEARANAWEEAEKSRYMARLEREGAKVRAWENHQKAKFEAELRAEEIKLEKRRADAQDRMMRRVARTKQQSEAKLAAIEAQKNRQAAITLKRVHRIRRTGSTSSSNLLCCSGFF